VFGGPVSLWVPLARLVGVKIERPETVDDALLAEAEAGALLAARRFGPGLLAATVGTIGLLAWMPLELKIMNPYLEYWFEVMVYNIEEMGGPFALAMALPSIAVLLIALAAGLANAAVFGAIPLVLLRRCTKAAAPAVAIAMAQGDDAFADEQAAAYPRVAFAAERILYPRGR
jgi:hypothetical protein